MDGICRVLAMVPLASGLMKRIASSSSIAFLIVIKLRPALRMVAGLILMEVLPVPSFNTVCLIITRVAGIVYFNIGAPAGGTIMFSGLTSVLMTVWFPIRGQAHIYGTVPAIHLNFITAIFITISFIIQNRRHCLFLKRVNEKIFVS